MKALSLEQFMYDPDPVSFSVGFQTPGFWMEKKHRTEKRGIWNDSLIWDHVTLFRVQVCRKQQLKCDGLSCLQSSS